MRESTSIITHSLSITASIKANIFSDVRTEQRHERESL